MGAGRRQDLRRLRAAIGGTERKGRPRPAMVRRAAGRGNPIRSGALRPPRSQRLKCEDEFSKIWLCVYCRARARVCDLDHAHSHTHTVIHTWTCAVVQTPPAPPTRSRAACNAALSLSCGLGSCAMGPVPFSLTLSHGKVLNKTVNTDNTVRVSHYAHDHTATPSPGVSCCSKRVKVFVDQLDLHVLGHRHQQHLCARARLRLTRLTANVAQSGAVRGLCARPS